LSKIQSKPSKTSIPFQVGKTTGINFTRVRELDRQSGTWLVAKQSQKFEY